MILIPKKKDQYVPRDILMHFDAHLNEKWDVSFKKTNDLLVDLLLKDPKLSKYASIFEREFEKNVSRGRDESTEFYDKLADLNILGLTTSTRRHLLIDSLAITYSILNDQKITGPILDLGCHVGIFSDTLSSSVVNKIHGVDRSAKAITLAKNIISNPSLTFSTQFDRAKMVDFFSFTIAISVLSRNFKEAKDTIKLISDSLVEGGVALIVSSWLLDYDQNLLRKALIRYRLGFAYADVVGGYGGCPNEFKCESVLVLVKAHNEILPDDLEDQMDSDWPRFQKYANTPSTVEYEKTLAYMRATDEP